jgi:hypothetical protein
MEDHQFDALLQRVARQTSRRATLATLLGGALLLLDSADGDATKKAKRRHRRHQRAQDVLKPIWFNVDNTVGTKGIRVGATTVVNSAYCMSRGGATVPPGAIVPFAMHDPTGFMAFTVADTQYWFTFDNPTLARPDVSVALNGSTRNIRPNEWCPFRHGVQYLNDRAMDEGSTIEITLNGHYFRVRRLPDTNYKNFTVVLPATL